MSLVFSAITPHPPILIPQIGKDNVKLLYSTQSAFRNLASKLKDSEPDTLIIISPHGLIHADAFTINQNPQFTATFEEFGDLATKLSYKGNIGLTHKIKENLETNIPLQLMSEEKIDHGVSVPLFNLSSELPNIKIIPLYYSGLNNQEHFDFGKVFGQEIIYDKNKIAVIASADLSHCLTRNAPGKYSTKGKKFDQKVISSLQEGKIKDLIEMDPKLTSSAQQCGLKSIIILAGILDGMKYRTKMLSYEYPFGIGYLVMNFEL
jgi:AmmeMemoRadiSam system protein B